MLVPYGDTIIAKRVGDPSKSSGGAIRSASLEENSVKVKVVSSGKDGIEKGDTLIVRKYSGNEYEYEGEKILFINSEDIVAMEKPND